MSRYHTFLLSAITLSIALTRHAHSPNFIPSYRVHYVQQALVAVHIVVHHIVCRHLIEQLLCARDFCLLDGSQFQCLHRTFGFSHKENVLDGALVECDCPVRRIVAYRRGNLFTRERNLFAENQAAALCFENQKSHWPTSKVNQWFFVSRLRPSSKDFVATCAVLICSATIAGVVVQQATLFGMIQC